MRSDVGEVLQYRYYDKHADDPDVRYAALAIGANPSDPPIWALRACTRFCGDYLMSAERFDESCRMLDVFRNHS